MSVWYDLINVQAVLPGAFDRAEKMLAGMEDDFWKAIKDVREHVTSKIRTYSVKAIQQQYAISAANIRANENIEITYNYASGILAQVTFYGRKIPLYRYDGASPKWPTLDTSKKPVIVDINNEKRAKVFPGVTAQGHQLRSTSPEKIQGAFTAEMPSEHKGFFKRTGGKTPKGANEIREIMGSSVPQMLGNKEVEKKVVEAAVYTFQERLDHNIMAILNGDWR